MSIDWLRTWLWEGIVGIQSGRAVKRRSASSRRVSPRALRVEPLEQRELLSVTASALGWKDFAFTSTGLVTGTLYAAHTQSNGSVVNIPISVYHDTTQPKQGAAFDGTIQYTSATQGKINDTTNPAPPEMSSITGYDAWKYNVPASYNPPPPGTWTLAGGTIISATDALGKLTGTADLTTVDANKYFTATNTDKNGNLVTHDLGGIYIISGSYSPSTLALSSRFTVNEWDNTVTPPKHVLWGSLVYTGTMTPMQDPQNPFDINIVQQNGQQSGPVPQLQWETINGVPSVEFDVNVSGPVQKVKTETTPVTYVQAFWAKGPNLSDRLSTKALALDTLATYKSGIPIYWNQASGHYTLSKFLPAKILAGATNLLFTTKFVNAQGVLQEKLLATLDLPEVSIEKRTVNEAPAGTKVNEAFLVTYSVPDGFTSSNTVTVAWKTGNGTAIANKDYMASGGILTFAAPGTQTITVPILGDSISIPDGTFIISATVTNAGFAGPAVEAIQDTAPQDRSSTLGRSAALGAYFSQLGQDNNKDAAGDLNPAVV